MSASDLAVRRAYECRLTPDRALESLEDAAAWLAERGLVTLNPCCSLPSLHAAVHEEPYAPGKRGFAAYPKTRWWWGGALASRPDVLWAKVHGGKGLLMADWAARLADPLSRAALAEAEQGAYGEDERRLVRHLATAGPSLLDDLNDELGPVKRTRRRLERVGAIVARGVVLEPHRHTSELLRWDQLFPEPSAGGIEELLVAGVRAAVVAPERELQTWFSWPLPPDAVDRLVDAGRLTRADGLVSVATSPLAPIVSRASGW